MKSSQALAKNQEQTTEIALNVKPFEQLSPAQISRDLASVSDLSIAVKIADKIPAIAVIGKVYGRDKAELLIKAFIFDLEDFLDFDKKMNAVQLNFITTEIMTRYASLTLADIHLVFRNAKGGKYGEFFGRIAPDRILKWFADYWAERCDAFATISYGSAVSTDKGSNITSKVAAEKLAKLEEKFKAP